MSRLYLCYIAIALSFFPWISCIDVKGFVTSTDKTQLLSPIQVNAQCAGSPLPPDPEAVQIDFNKVFQKIEGYGAAMTDSSAYLLSQFPETDSLLEKLFSPENGVGFSLLRVPIGMSDFSLQVYTFDDSPGDYSLANFSIAHDLKYMIPMLLKVQRVNPSLRLILTPWTAPIWLKVSGTRGSGPLLASESAYDTYAEYLARSVKAYRDAGLDVAYLTLQNEPLHDDCDDMPCMSMDPIQAIELSVRVGLKMEALNLTSTTILAYDHNWDHPEYPISVLSNTTASKYVGGSAFHCYAGDVSAQSSVYDLFPDKTILLTECSGGEWAPEQGPRIGDFPGNLNWELANMIIGGAKYFASGSLYWNIALDDEYGPKTLDVGGCMNCRGVVTIPRNSTSISDVTFNSEFYALSALSSVVPPKSTRVDLFMPGNLTKESVIGSAFTQPDGGVALVLANGNPSPQTIRVISEECTFNITVPEGVVSLFWKQHF